MFGGTNRKALARYFAISQVGMMMVVPAGIGILLDRYLDWTPWGVISGAVLGLICGLVQLVRLSKDQDKDKPGSQHHSQQT